MNTLDLFAGFDLAIVAAIQASNTVEKEQQGQARAHKAKARHHARRANGEKTLADILPATIDDGDAWHVVSRGDIDALSYLTHTLKGAGHFDHVSLSTWCMARPDVEQLAAWMDQGLIDTLELYVGEIFPGQYPGEWEAALALEKEYGVKLIVAKNHSKVICAGRADLDYWLVIEGSANVNTNPRIEQTTITRDKALFDFYREFFNGIRSIDKRTAS